MPERPPIRVLPPLLVNQIAAGEVVDRPASVVKELVENAIDAGARRIEVTIEGGGRDLIRVTDDGCGIPADELPLALAAHATSKIRTADDLVAIATMGFRGEALASIASVSRLAVRSRTADAVAAAEILADGGQVDGPRPAAGPTGTSVTVRTLFHNVPARRKFLKSESAEGSRIADTLESIALGHPQVTFVLRSASPSGERTLLDLPATTDARRRALDVLGKELAPKLLEAEGEDGGATVWGLVGLPELAKPSVRHLRVHLNGRPVADRSIIHALREAYRGLVEPGRSPIAILHIEMDPREVDVNVHPAKSEVRFRSPSVVHQLVLRAVRRALRAADLVPAFELPATAMPGATPSAGAIWSRPGPGAVAAPAAAPIPLELDVVREALGAMPALAPTSPAASIVEPSLPTVLRPLEILQIHSSFVVTHDEQGILIVDQHALHERVMFEKLLERVARGDLESQRLLVPTIVEATPAEVEALGDLGELLARIGLDAVAAGPRAVAVHGYPSFLFERGVDPVDFVPELLGKAADGTLAATGRSSGARKEAMEASLAATLDMMSCKAAVKAGDRLSVDELRELLAWRERVERSTNCPHGRPTSLRITIRDLERQFGRS